MPDHLHRTTPPAPAPETTGAIAPAFLERIEAVLDQRVRPVLQLHDGAIAVRSLDQAGVLRVEFLGQCAGCPAADLSLQSLVREELVTGVDEVTDVVLISGVSDDLLGQARRLLGDHRDQGLGRGHRPLTLAGPTH